MTLTTHAIAGAALALIVPTNPALAFVLGFASHFPLDAIPHYDYPIYSDSIHPKKPDEPIRFDPLFARDAADFSLDAAIGIAVAVAIFSAGVPLPALLAGAVGGIIPDPLQVMAKKFPYAPLRSLQQFHQWMHTRYRLRESGQVVLGVVSQLALIALIIIATKSTALF